MIIEITTDRLNSIGGIAIAGKIFQSIELDLKDNPEIQHREVCRSMAGLLLQGRAALLK